jgi:N-methylhydantoinase A
VTTVAAVDVGGTFTDIVLLDEATAEARFGKVPTTPGNPADGVLAAFDALGVDPGTVDTFLHGTTIGLNALLERKAQSVGLITTRGFRDVVEIRRASWPMYRLHWDQPEPLVPRHLRLEVGERTLADGSIDTPLDADDVRRAARQLVDEGVEAVAVCLLHSYMRPDHEEQCGRILREEFPQLQVSLSHEITREYREYERTATTVVDAALKPTMVRYLRDVERRLQERGFGGSFMITRCDGGVMSVDEACEKVIRVLVSGPASGIMGAAALARLIGAPRLIACDMGGTSFDMALILDGEPDLQSITYVEGIPLLMPVVGMHAIGAGGGSLAWIDAGGALNFGPQSAGADPGPVCYGRGGTRPTFTDAAVISGLIDPAYFLGGRLELDIARARAAFDEHIVRRLGLAGVEEAASGIVDLAESKMAAAIESITVEKGHDPREFVLLAFGGGGPLVAAGLARRLQIPRVIVPESPGTFSARGMTALDLVHDFARTTITPEASIGPVATRLLRELHDTGDEALAREHVPAEQRELQSFIDARYASQEHTITLALGADGAEEGLDSAAIRARFDERHESVYSYKMPDDPIEAVAFRVRAVGRRSAPIGRRVDAAGPNGGPPRKGERRASHPQSGRDVVWAVYERADLAPGARIEGPAIVEEASTTILVHAGGVATLDDFGNLVIDSTGAASDGG